MKKPVVKKQVQKNKKPAFGAKRYDEDTVSKIVAFLKAGHTNTETKAKFGCSAHFAGNIRSEFKVPFPERSKPTPPKKAAPAKPVKKAAPKKAAPAKPVKKAAPKKEADAALL